MTLDEFFAEAKRIGLTAEVFAAQLAERPEFADCLPLASPASEAEPVAWQERQKNLMGWTSWYESRSTCTVGKTEAFALTAGGIPYEFRPLYATPPAATPATPGEVTLLALAKQFGASVQWRMGTKENPTSPFLFKFKPEQLEAFVAALAHPAPMAAPASVPQAIDQLVSALAESKGWMRDYARALIEDAIDRRHLEVAAPAPASEAEKDANK